MSILIKDIEMPTSCPCELLGIGYDLYCSFTGGIPARVKEYYECCQNGTRPSWCPLVPVPPHGRLIDADALIAKLNMMIAMAFGEGNTAFHFAYRSLGKVVENAPTIIEADEGET